MFEYRRIFILGHMRSRSSLLAHILLSNPQIVGTGESNAVYQNFLKCHWMDIKAHLKNRKIPYTRIFLDQINHNTKTPNKEIIYDNKTKVIILIRQPNETISSILKLSEKFYNNSWTVMDAANYYLDRLKFISSILKNKKPNDIKLILSDQLINDDKNILQSVSHFLGLKIPLKSNYSTFSFTGLHGDPSKNINSGYIIKANRTPTTNIEYNLDLHEKIYLQLANQASSLKN